MGKMIPQKSFDSQLHIIRDARFDVDKYKIGELYVINNSSKHIDDNVWHIGSDKKVVGILKYAHEKFLTFQVLRYYEHDNSVSYNSAPLRIDIDDIIDKQIEIERLLTETEAAVYLSMIVPDYSQFPYTLERTHSYQALQAAYKIDEETAKDCVDFGQIAKDLVEEDPNIIDKTQYVCYLSSRKPPVPFTFINENGTFAHELFDGYDTSLKVTLIKGDTIISMRTAVKNLKVDVNTITIGNGNHTISITLHKDSFYKVYDKITFEP